MGTSRGALRLFDAHCHLQDPRILHVSPQLIHAALSTGVRLFAVNGVSEKDWHLVKQMADEHPSVIPCFGLHPWYVEERSPDWLNSMKELFETTPSAAVGEVGLDKGSRGKHVDFHSQVQVFRQQLQLAKELAKPVSVHCVRAFDPQGHFRQKAKKMLKSIPAERILLETDAPDALPQAKLSSLMWVPGDESVPKELQLNEEKLGPGVSHPFRHESHISQDTSALPKETLNHPANIHKVLNYVASLLEMSEEELAEICYQNAVRLFSYSGSKVPAEY